MSNPGDAPISSLRQRLIDDITLRRFSQETRRNYLPDVGRFASFLGRPPVFPTDEKTGLYKAGRVSAMRHRVGATRQEQRRGWP